MEQLKKLLKWKMSKSKLAAKLGVSFKQLEEMLAELGPPTNKDTFNIKKQTDNSVEVSAYWDHEPTPEEIIQKHKIDTTKWRLSSFWSKGKSKGYLVSALFTPLSKDPSLEFETKFIEFLTNYTPKFKYVLPNPLKIDKNRKKGILIVNKQDAHLNKLDILGKNNIHERFSSLETALQTLVQQAHLSSDIEEVVFIVGSDEFNSEWTGMTTKGTPQENILTYEESFELICQHNFNLLQILYGYCKNIKVIFVKGNHDAYVGWHMVKWLEAACKNLSLNISFDTKTQNRKYHKYRKVGFMFNHGDELSHKDLAQIFPIEFKDDWSSCSKFNIFTGDKHHEKTNTIVGIKAYQLPALSTSKSRWDDKKGFLSSEAEMQIFLVNGETGNTYIYKEYL